MAQGRLFNIIDETAVDAANVYAMRAGSFVPVAVSDSLGIFDAPDVLPGTEMQARRVGFANESFTAPPAGEAVVVYLVPDTLPDLVVEPEPEPASAAGGGVVLLLLLFAALSSK